MKVDAGLMRRFAQEGATFRARVKERETARQEYIRMLRDVANAVEADPTAFLAAAVQVRDTSAVVCDAFEKGGA